MLTSGSADDDAPQSLTDIVVNYGMGEGEVSLMSLSDQWHAPAANLHINYHAPAPATPPADGGLMLDNHTDTGQLDIKQNYEPVNFEKRLDIDTLRQQQFEKERELELPSYCHSLEQVNGDLWCAEFDKHRILVLNTATGSVAKTIKSNMLDHPACIINTVSISGDSRFQLAGTLPTDVQFATS